MSRVAMAKGVLANYFSTRSRRRKVKYFQSRILPTSTVLVVGVSGGSERTPGENMIERWLFEERQAVGLSYDPPQAGLPGTTVRGDARQLPFADNAFDYVVSNAVIEHVGGPEGARLMLAESRRVAKLGYLHTTPNRRFPVETHTRVLMRHWAPRRLYPWVWGRIGMEFPASHYWLYTPRAAKRLSDEVRVDRLGMAGMTFVMRWEPWRRD